ncbi:MAG: PhoH family protein [Candidatus Omnitrophica bacterium]|nr:PhoH family protein [Candidatus Omnitrophota bacterium]
MEKTLKLNSNDEAIQLYGNLDENLRFAEKEFRVHISARNHRLTLTGSKKNVDAAYQFFLDQLELLRSGKVSTLRGELGTEEKDWFSSTKGKGPVSFFHRGKIIKGKSKGQEAYLEAIQHNDIVISIGPAGTGKTYLAMAAAIDALKKKQVARIVLTRPAVEAGESLGFLPGDLYAKINPYLRPLYDALYEMVEFEEAARYIERGIIEVAPLAYMRGRTLNDAFVILDEAQNSTHSQMKMFLTRLGFSSKAVITGDITQIDLPGGKHSGLVESQTILASIKGIKFVHLTEKDVVRHPLVQEIIRAYERYEKK